MTELSFGDNIVHLTGIKARGTRDVIKPTVSVNITVTVERSLNGIYVMCGFSFCMQHTGTKV